MSGTITGNVSDTEGNPLANAEIYVKLDGIEYVFATITVNGTEVATRVFTDPSSPGGVSIQVSKKRFGIAANDATRVEFDNSNNGSSVGIVGGSGGGEYTHHTITQLG